MLHGHTNMNPKNIENLTVYYFIIQAKSSLGSSNNLFVKKIFLVFILLIVTISIEISNIYKIPRFEILSSRQKVQFLVVVIFFF
jgi:hypothetical protein